MARGRFISQEIAKDKKINDLSNDTSRLAFTWLVATADSEGRTYGDPAIVRSMIFPRRSDITTEQMEFYIQEWHNAGLVVWYEADGDLWICFPNFEKHQVGLRKDREAPSAIPAPPILYEGTGTDEVRSNAGVTPELDGLIKVNIKESEVNGFRLLFDAFLQASGVNEFDINPQKACDEINKQWQPINVTPDEVANAVSILRSSDTDYTIAGPWSITKTIKNQRAKQNGRTKSEERKYSEVY